MRTNLNRSVRRIVGVTWFLAVLTASIPVLAQQDATDPGVKLAVWLTGEPGQARAGVVFLRQQKKWVLDLKDSTTVVANGKTQWNLSTLVGFMNFALVGNQAFPVVSPTGSLNDASAIGLSPIAGFSSFSIKIDHREDVFSRGSKVGRQTTKGRIGGFLARDASGGVILLPLAGGYSAGGTIVTSISGAGKQKEEVTIKGAVPGVLHGKLVLALLGSTEAGQQVTFALPELIDAASASRTYTGPVTKNDSFEPAK